MMQYAWVLLISIVRNVCCEMLQSQNQIWVSLQRKPCAVVEKSNFI